MKIVEALAQLDTGNDLHWTDDGLPSLEAVGAIYGKEVNRATLTRIAPDFTRATASDPAAKPAQDADETVEEAPEPADDQVEDEPELTGDGQSSETKDEDDITVEPRDPSTFEPIGDLPPLDIAEGMTRERFDRMADIDAEALATASPQDRLRLFDRAVSSLMAMRDQINKVLESVQADRDLAVEDEQTADTPLHDAVQDYFKSQDRARDEARAIALEASKAFGVQLSTAAGGSQLDLSMARRGGLGTVRPAPRAPGA